MSAACDRTIIAQNAAVVYGKYNFAPCGHLVRICYYPAYNAVQKQLAVRIEYSVKATPHKGQYVGCAADFSSTLYKQPAQIFDLVLQLVNKVCF